MVDLKKPAKVANANKVDPAKNVNIPSKKVSLVKPTK